MSRGTQDRCPEDPPAPPPTGLSPSAVPPSSGFGLALARLPCGLPLLATSSNPVPGEPATVWAAARLARHYYGPLVLDFSSSGYSDVSLPPVPSRRPIDSAAGARASTRAGCPIRTRTAPRLPAAPRPRFAARRVLPRLLAPRHPPHTLLSLAVPAHKSGICMPLSHRPSTRCKHVSLRCDSHRSAYTRSAKLKETLAMQLSKYMSGQKP